ncbi:hypothetical protein Nepgr_017376 [Nepenthes gracilis]|uniref:Uncharacterized protein n=1 Tax=Nepenthes gracilis TaxID=150966 RepID=A0AAD3SRB9_NEPGR|nr:hypothetical protein Nepgr_017376 [Nepenthes gracilis]
MEAHEGEGSGAFGEAATTGDGGIDGQSAAAETGAREGTEETLAGGGREREGEEGGGGEEGIDCGEVSSSLDDPVKRNSRHLIVAYGVHWSAAVSAEAVLSKFSSLVYADAEACGYAPALMQLCKQCWGFDALGVVCRSGAAGFCALLLSGDAVMQTWDPHPTSSTSLIQSKNRSQASLLFRRLTTAVHIQVSSGVPGSLQMQLHEMATAGKLPIPPAAAVEPLESRDSSLLFSYCTPNPLSQQGCPSLLPHILYCLQQHS